MTDTLSRLRPTYSIIPARQRRQCLARIMRNKMVEIYDRTGTEQTGAQLAQICPFRKYNHHDARAKMVELEGKKRLWRVRPPFVSHTLHGNGGEGRLLVQRTFPMSCANYVSAARRSTSDDKRLRRLRRHATFKFELKDTHAHAADKRAHLREANTHTQKKTDRNTDTRHDTRLSPRILCVS